MNLTIQDLEEGDIVIVSANFGAGPQVKGVITEICSDIKNGRPGIDYRKDGAKEDSWAYLTQIVRVTKPLKKVGKIEPSMG